MNNVNKSFVIDSINTIRPRGQTNIYGEAIELLDTRDDKSRNGAIIMLTDGSPNISPAIGEVDTLRRLRLTKILHHQYIHSALDCSKTIII